jgi:hypothetical protein
MLLLVLRQFLLVDPSQCTLTAIGSVINFAGGALQQANAGLRRQHAPSMHSPHSLRAARIQLQTHQETDSTGV